MIGTYHGVRFWCNLDGCGFLCVLATWTMILFSVYVVVFILLRPTPLEECLSVTKVLTSLAFTTLAGLAVTAHMRTMLTDPGAVPRHATPIPVHNDEEASHDRVGGETGSILGDDEELGDDDAETSRLTATSKASARFGDTPGGMGAVRATVGRGGGSPNSSRQRREGEAAADEEQRRQHAVKWCHKCDAFKPPRAHHCSLCQRCIVKMDHHCPWVNNCVGIANQKLFLLFCAYTCALCAFALSIELIVVVIMRDDERKEACRLSPADHAATVALAAMSIMFGLFTCCMACDQCQVASTNQTKIDRLKGEVHDSVEGANEVFGGTDGQKFRCHWLLPLPARFPPGDAAARIFGYCVNSSGSSHFGGSDRSLNRRSVARGGRGGSSVGGAGVNEMELVEYGGVVPSRDGLDVAENGRHAGGGDGRGSGRTGVVYAATEAEVGLRHAARQSLGERLEAMHEEAGSGSEGELR